jgi:hypothetical protein
LAKLRDEGFCRSGFPKKKSRDFLNPEPNVLSTMERAEQPVNDNKNNDGSKTATA